MDIILFLALGTPSNNDFTAILKMKAIPNNPITTDDINLAEKILGRDIGPIKGKTTRKKPVPVVDEYIDIPKELIASQYAVKSSLDVINKCKWVDFCHNNLENLQCRTAQHMKYKPTTEYM
jgi:hypothetical protein